MTNNSKTQSKVKEFSFKNDILYPACILFTVIVFIYFIGAMLSGLNVTQTRASVTEIHDFSSGEDKVTLKSSVGESAALPLEMLFGLLLFSLSYYALKLLYRLDYGKTFITLLHFACTLLSFFVFVLALSGFVSAAGFGPSMLILLLVAIAYLAALGVKRLIQKPLSKIPENPLTNTARKYLPPVFTVFTVTVFVITLFAMITGELFDFKAIIKINERIDWPDERIRYDVYETVITPIAPTIQNYLRYLGSAFVFMCGYAVLFTKLNKVAKVILNFVIMSAGFILLWLIQLDFFREINKNMLIAWVCFIAVYLLSFITVSVVRIVLARRSEETDEYESQFLPGGRSKNS